MIEEEDLSKKDYKDWPEDKKTGPGFLRELMKQHPGLVTVVTPANVKDAMEEFFKDDEKK